MSDHKTEKETAAASVSPEDKAAGSRTIDTEKKGIASTRPGICLSLAIGLLASGAGIAGLVESHQLWSWDSGILLLGFITISCLICGLLGSGSAEVRDKRCVAGWGFSDGAILLTISTTKLPWIRETSLVLFIGSFLCYMLSQHARKKENTNTPEEQARSWASIRVLVWIFVGLSVGVIAIGGFDYFGPEGKNKAYRTVYDKGFDAGKSKDWGKAIDLYSQAIELNQGEFDAYLGRGNAYQQLGTYQAAVADYSKVVELRPDYVDAYLNRSLAFGRLGEYEKAIDDASRAIELGPTLVQGYLFRGSAHLGMGAYQQAIADYSTVIEGINLPGSTSENLSPEGVAARFMERYDSDKDGSLSPAEVNWSSPPDTNEDGKVSRQELLASFQKVRGSVFRPTVDGVVFYHRATAYQAIGEKGKADADFARAKELGYEPPDQNK